MLYATLSELKDACSGAHQDALRHAQREIGRGTFMARGKHLKALRDGDLVAGEAESWPWDGTLRSLRRAIAECDTLRADTLVVEGGIDYAPTPRDYADGAYDPWVGEWSITVWRRG